jgi:curved DNA-binding protein CbpA
VTEHDPFAALGLPARPDLSDDDVRAAWRRIAAATHPDREDGGDPARFGAAAAAYALLRTAYGRGEAIADLGSRAGRHAGRHAGPHAGRALTGARLAAAWRHRGYGGRVGVLALRVAVASAVCGGAVGVAGWAPASIGVLAGALTWLVATGRHDIARAGRE